jgi:hypothetical protein
VNSKNNELDSSLVSLAKARRILGEAASDLSDNQMIEIIQSLHLLAKSHLLYNGSNNEQQQ